MKTNSKAQGGIKVTVGIKSGGLQFNHSRGLARGNHRILAVKSGIKAGEGILGANHNRAIAKAKTGVKLATGIKAGGLQFNHSRSLSIKSRAALTVKSGIKAGEGILGANHNRAIAKAKTGVKLATGIKAGGLQFNHSRSLSIKSRAALTVKSGIKAGEGILGANHNRRLAK